MASIGVGPMNSLDDFMNVMGKQEVEILTIERLLPKITLSKAFVSVIERATTIKNGMSLEGLKILKVNLDNFNNAAAFKFGDKKTTKVINVFKDSFGFETSENKSDDVNTLIEEIGYSIKYLQNEQDKNVNFVLSKATKDGQGVAIVVKALIGFIEKNGLEKEGIYRLEANKTITNSLNEKLGQSDQSFIDSINSYEGKQVQSVAVFLKRVIHVESKLLDLTDPTGKAVLQHLKNIADNSGKNLMPTHNLEIALKITKLEAKFKMLES